MGKYLTTGQAASICSVTPDTVLKWVRAGHLAARRTAGGHHRIDLQDLERFFMPAKTEPLEADRSSSGLRHQASPHSFKFCWEFNGGGEMRAECLDCAVYLMRAHRCYEVAKLAPEAVHAKVFCEGSCQDCGYYREVHEQRTNVLVVSQDRNLTGELLSNAGQVNFNLEIADCEYTCSAVIHRFRPDFVIIDCDLGREASRDISSHLSQDPRIPFVRVVIAGGDQSLLDECDERVFARIERPFSVMEISNCVSGFDNCRQHPQPMAAAGERTGRGAGQIMGGGRSS